ncbi:MAG: putative sugar nucleotidyl transferase, partial [Ginsengibacter sp.]
MNKIIFTEEFCQPENLFPFTLTRQLQDIRIGILTIREKWEMMLGMVSFDKKEDDYKDLERSISLTDIAEDDICFMIHGNVLPTPQLVKKIKKLKNGEFISVKGNAGIIFRFTKKEIIGAHKVIMDRALDFDGDVKSLKFPWDIF